MQIYEIRVTPQVARLRSGDAGTRNVSVVHTFSRHPTYFAGEPPRELLEDQGLEVRQLPVEEGHQALRQGALVSAHRCPGERLTSSLRAASVATDVQPAPTSLPVDLIARVEALDRAFAEVLAMDPVGDLEAIVDRLPEMNRQELAAVHEQVLGKKPHGNARNESVREAILEALTSPAESADS